VTSGKDMLDRLVEQVTLPVRWDLVMAKLGELGVSGAVELPPGGTLSGLVKRELRAATLPLKSPQELDKLADFFAEHGGDGAKP
jgi:[acyl-carrier-protein] S-malonyltransferase